MTPYEAVYGQAPPFLLPYTPSCSPVQAVDVALRNHDEVLRICTKTFTWQEIA